MSRTRSNRQLISKQRCFLCLSSVLSKKLDDYEKYYFDEQLDVVFLLRYCLKIPSSHCEVFLRENGNPSTWLDVCENCESMIQKTRNSYTNAQKLLQIFKNGVECIETKLVASFNNEYDDISDGNTWATPLARKIRQIFLHRKILNGILCVHKISSNCNHLFMTL